MNQRWTRPRSPVNAMTMMANPHMCCQVISESHLPERNQVGGNLATGNTSLSELSKVQLQKTNGSAGKSQLYRQNSLLRCKLSVFAPTPSASFHRITNKDKNLCVRKQHERQQRSWTLLCGKVNVTDTPHPSSDIYGTRHSVSCFFSLLRRVSGSQTKIESHHARNAEKTHNTNTKNTPSVPRHHTCSWGFEEPTQ